MGQLDKDAGFSLVELMIVVAIISVLTVGVTLSVGHRDRKAAGDIALFQDQIAILRTEAVLGGQPTALQITDSSLTRWQRGAAGFTATGGAMSLRGEIQVSPGYGTVETVDGTFVHFLPDGRSSAFEATLDTQGGTWACVADGWSDLSCEARP